MTKENLFKTPLNDVQFILQKFEKIWIDQNVIDTELAKRFFQIFPAEKIQITTEAEIQNRHGELSAKEFSQSKKNIFLTSFKGEFFKRCPGSNGSNLACCNYYVLNLGLQCDMNCSYCYLQSFINSKYLTIYTNIDQALEELKLMYKASPTKSLRVGTGETIDSLSLDPLTQYSKKLVQAFKEMPEWKLEFKTKSHFVDEFIDESHAKNMIVSWSINPQYIIDHEEHLTSSLEQRLSAAERVVQKGFILSFHIDPMIWHPNWEQNYKNLAIEITKRFRPEDVIAISVGTLRFQPEQRHMMRQRFGMNSYVTKAETFKSHDGKYRYDLDLRNEMYQNILNVFRSHSPRWRVFMCMESPETWLNQYEKHPMQVQGLQDLFKPIMPNVNK